MAKKTEQSRTGDTPTILLPILGIALLGAVVYSNTFRASFHFDDFTSIVDNGAIRDATDFRTIWRFLNRRFIGYLSFAINYRLHGLDVAGYHVVNLLVHVGASISAFFLARAIFSTPAVKKLPIGRHGGFIAAASGLVFAAHPLQTQAVTYIVQRLASLAALFYMASLALYLYGRLRSSRTRRWYFIGSAAAGVLGLFTKENVVTLPFAILLCELYFFEGPSGLASLLRDKKRAAIAAAAIVVFLAAVFRLFSLRLRYLFMPVTSQRLLDPPLTSLTYFMTQFRVLVAYIRLLFLPVGQNVDHDIPAAEGFFEPRIALSFLVLAAVAVLAVVLFRRYRTASFGIAWFFLTLAVESSFKPLLNVMFEHRLYLPMFGFALFFASMLFHALGNRNRRAAVAVCLALILAASVLTYRRNEVWRDDITLWRDAVGKSPGKPRTHLNLGLACHRAGDDRRAEEQFRKALALYPQYIDALNDLGNILTERGMLDEAEALFRRALRLNPNVPETSVNLGALLQRRGEIDEAVALYEKAVSLESRLLTAHVNLGRALAGLGRYGEAAEHFEAARALDPGHAEILIELGDALFFAGRRGEALNEYRKAREMLGDTTEILRRIGIVLSENGNQEAAESTFRKALSLGEETELYLLLGHTLREQERFGEAVRAFERAVEMEPRNHLAHRRLAQCYESMGDGERAAEHRETARRLSRGTPADGDSANVQDAPQGNRKER